MADTVVHEQELSRYSLLRDGQRIGFAEYEIHGNAIHFTHTEIDPDKQEKGMGSELVKAALDDVAANSTARVVAKCPFVFRYIAEHDEYKPLTQR